MCNYSILYLTHFNKHEVEANECHGLPWLEAEFKWVLDYTIHVTVYLGVLMRTCFEKASAYSKQLVFSMYN